MKKILFSLLGALFTFGVAQAQTLSIEDVYVKPGATASFDMKITPGSGEWLGIQGEMYFPATGFSLTETIETSMGWYKPIELVGALDANGVGRFSVASTQDGESFTSGVPEYIRIGFTVDDDVDYGNYNVTIKDFAFLDGTNADKTGDVSFTIHVTDSPIITLNENSKLAPEKTDVAVDIVVKRTINADKWSTICFPFPMSAVKLKAAFGDDYSLAEFSDFESVKDNNGNVTSITMKFKTRTAAALANTPYIIKISQDVNEFTVNAKLNPSNSLSKAIMVLDEETGEEVEIGSFNGTYKAGTIVPPNCLFISDNKFYYSTGSTEIKAFRGYFALADVLPYENGSDVKISIDVDGSTTSINAIENDGIQTGEVYDLSGRKVSKPQIRGIYIVDGKKIAVK